jgi:hypothetical protein
LHHPNITASYFLFFRFSSSDRKLQLPFPDDEDTACCPAIQKRGRILLIPAHSASLSLGITLPRYTICPAIVSDSGNPVFLTVDAADQLLFRFHDLSSLPGFPEIINLFFLRKRRATLQSLFSL